MKALDSETMALWGESIYCDITEMLEAHDGPVSVPWVGLEEIAAFLLVSVASLRGTKRGVETANLRLAYRFARKRLES